MSSEIVWREDLDGALEAARDAERPVFVDFFDPECGGCRSMDTVTFSLDQTQSFVTENVIPVKLDIGRHEQQARRLGVSWAPGLVWLNPEGEVAHRSVGYRDPEEFLAECQYGIAQAEGSRAAWEQARGSFDRVQELWPSSDRAPDALYWSGVAAKKSGAGTEALLDAWNRLLETYPESEAAKKVAFIRNV